MFHCLNESVNQIKKAGLRLLQIELRLWGFSFLEHPVLPVVCMDLSVFVFVFVLQEGHGEMDDTSLAGARPPGRRPADLLLRWRWEDRVWGSIPAQDWLSASYSESVGGKSCSSGHFIVYILHVFHFLCFSFLKTPNSSYWSNYIWL